MKDKPFGDVRAQHSSLVGGGKFSPLSALRQSALRRYGDINAGVDHAEVDSLFLELANEVVEEVNRHPYVDTYIEPYTHSEESRPIPDEIMMAGLLYLYAEQQGSRSTDLYRIKYFRSMNGVLHRLKFGKQPIILRPLDKEV